MKKQVSVGVGYINYAVKRTILGKISTLKYLKTYDINLVKAVILQRTSMSVQDYKHLFIPGFSTPRSVDFYHLFNAICLHSNNRKPWITSFETIVPRLSVFLSEHKQNFPDYSKFKNLINRNGRVTQCLRSIASPDCINLIALSRNAFEIQNDFFESLDCYNRFDRQKVIHLFPPQQILQTGGRTIDHEKIKFLFVGNDFFRKGGYEALVSLVDLRNRYQLPLCFTIIGSIREEWFGNSSPDKIKETFKLLDENKHWVTYYRSLPNDKVLELMKEADVGILPTWSDSFGYSILEMQASGVPVITTDVRAIPEINNDQSGWLISLPKNRYGELMDVTSKKEEISQMICYGIKEIVMDIFAQPSEIIFKSNASLSRIKQYHDPGKYSNQLEAIYTKALTSK